MMTRAFEPILTSLMVALLMVAPRLAAQGSTDPDQRFPFVTGFKCYGVEDGLPSEKIMSILVAGKRVYAGTDRGLAQFRDGRWKLHLRKGKNVMTELYDLETDPGEQVDRSREHPEIVERMQSEAASFDVFGD